MLEYINLRYRPSVNNLVCQYYIELNNCSLEEAAEQIAAESSIGTWTELSTMKPEVASRLKPTIFSMKKNEIKIAYSADLFENGNMPQILSSIAGNIFGMKLVKNLRLEDISFPECIVKSFKGPEFGINGIRNLLKIKERQLVGTIVKPKVGLSSKEHAQVAYEAWTGGLDIVKDDENLTNQDFNPFKSRVMQTLQKRDKAEDITGEKKMYMPNITAETNEMLKRAEFVKDLGGEYVMIDIITAGFSALQTLRDADLGLVIHAHRAMHAAITRTKQHGISMLAIAKISRLIGVDQLHIGTAVGKMEGKAIETEEIEHEIEDSIVYENKSGHILEQKWRDIKPVFAVSSGGLHPGLIPKVAHILGKNVIMQFGGGVHGHPLGTRKGAIAVRQALDAYLKEIPLDIYAKSHSELKIALDKWGM